MKLWSPKMTFREILEGLAQDTRLRDLGIIIERRGKKQHDQPDH